MSLTRFFSILIVLLFLSIQSLAQITINGTITDADQNPINNALVEIIDQDDTTNFYSVNTNESGYFSISNIFTDLVERKDIIPSDFIVLRNYPNPFNPSTIIYYELPKSENIEIRIYDILGREVRTLFNDFHKAGTYTLEWNGRNNWNASVAAGVYFCRLKTKDNFKVHKMLLLDGGTSTNSSSSQIKKEKSETFTKTYSVFNFTVLVSGNDILESDFTYLSCSGDTTLNLVVSKILQTAIIGPEGGIIEVDGFSITVPPSAFEGTIEIRLFNKPTNEWDTNNASSIFGVSGLPYYFNLPLNININPTTELKDESYIAIGQDYQLPFANTIEPIYKFLETEKSPGTLSCQLFPDSSFNNSNLWKRSKLHNYFTNKMFFTAKTSYKDGLSHKKHFKIFVDTKTNIDPYVIISNLSFPLENIFNTVKTAGFDTIGINWPVEVRIKKLRPTLKKRGCIYAPTYNIKNMILLIDETVLAENVVSDNIILREYAIGITRSYDKDFFMPLRLPRKINPKRYWFHHAVGSWFESEKSGYYPTDYFGFIESGGSGDNRFAPFSGMQYGAIKSIDGGAAPPEKSLSHGGGMSSFIKYINNDFGEEFISNIFKLIKKENLHPIEAVKEYFADSYLWWPDYIEDLISGDLYYFTALNSPNSVPPKYYIADEYKFKDKTDTLKIFSNSTHSNFVSLSAEGYLIRWDPKNIDSSRIMTISLMENENSFQVYTDDALAQSNTLTFLGKGKIFPIKIIDLLSNNNGEVWIFVTNSECEPPYLNKSNFKLEVKLEEPEPLPPEANIGISAHFLHDLHIKDPTLGEIDVIGTDRVYNHWYGSAKLINDSTYHAEWDEVDQIGYHHMGSLEVVIDLYTKNLKFFSAGETQDGDRASLIIELIVSKEIDIPTYSTTFSSWTFLKKGAEAYSMIHELYYSSDNNISSEKSTKFSYNDDSSILIYLDFDK